MTGLHNTPYARRIITFAQTLNGGGVERALLRLTRGWMEAGRQVTLVVGRFEGPLTAEAPPGLDIVELGSSWFPTLSTAHHHVIERQADLIFCPGNHYSSVAILTRIMLGRASPPIVAKVSNALVRSDQRGLMVPAYRFWLRRHGPRIDHFVAMTAAMREEVVRMMRVSPDRVSIIPNPPAPFHADAPGPLTPDGRYLIGVGRLEPQKRWDRLIAAMPRLADRETTLMIVGEGSMRAELEAQVASLGLNGRVLMPGYVADPSRLIAGARVAVLTSEFEGVPGVLREALAVGTPVVTTDSSVAVREIVKHPGWGDVVPREDGNALVTALDRWMVPECVRPTPVPQPGGDSAVRYLELFDRLVAAKVSPA